MKRQTAITIFDSLASGVRLDMFRLLAGRGPDGMVAGEIAAALDIPPTNASFHLKALTQAGLLTVEQEGRYQRYRANFALMTELIGYLTDECCSGHPERCIDLRKSGPRRIQRGRLNAAARAGGKAKPTQAR